MAGKLISDLNSGTLSIDDAMEIDKDVSGTRTSYKTTVKDIVGFANHNLAEEYDSTSTYAVDDYVIYESVLYKCIASTTGTFDSTKWTSVVVTDEMGSGGGGGTGGHTIIDENGNSMSARAGLQFIGGANVSDDATNNKTIVDVASAGGIDGVFIDTGNVIVQETQISASGLSYTATEDCFVSLYIYSTNDVYVKIDNVYIVGNFSQANGDRQTFLIPLKKGQTLTTTSGNTNNTYTVYGIQTGTTHSKFQPVIYSTEEREIGVWTDGKPLYQRTFEFDANDLQTESYGKYIDFAITDIDKLCLFDIVIEGGDIELPFYTSGSNYISTFNIISQDNVRFKFRYGNDVISDLSAYFANSKAHLYYTKSTDVAGSGTWTPQGVPTHHYSTDEHIIGTWIDGKTLYEKTLELSSIPSTSPISIDVSTLNIETMVGATGEIYAISNGVIVETVVLPAYISQSYYGAIRFMNNNVQILHTGLGDYSSGNITIQYTKSS